jgi:hypothetical protein
MSRRISLALAVAAAVWLAAAPSDARPCRGRRSTQVAMWYSILHPGVGEWYLKGFGRFEKAPQKKFWFGFIPGFGWPGYLQVKSARDAARCRVNDELF